MPPVIHHVRRALMLTALSLALALSIAGVCPAAQGDDKVQANLESVLLEDFIRFFGKYTGRNIVYRADQIPKINFNIYSQDAITEPELMAIFQEVMANAGLSAVSRDDALYIYPLAQAKKIGPKYEKQVSSEGTGDELVTSVYQLGKNMSAQTAITALKGLISPMGDIAAIPQARSVIITDTRDRMETIVEVIRDIESMGSTWDFEVIPLREANAERVISVINDMYQELKRRGEATEGMPLLSAIKWSNSILVSGTDEQKREIRDFLRRLDQVSEEDEGLIRVYRLQNAEAASVAGVLQSLMEAKLKAQEKDQEDMRVTVSDVFKVSADTTTNSLVVLSSSDVFPQVERILEELDKPLDQVYIECLIMETSLANTSDFGVEWFVGGANDAYIGQVGFMDTTDGSLIPYASPVIGADSLGVPNFAALPGGFSVGVLGNIITYGGQYFPTVGALANFVKGSEDVKIISTPQIMTLDHAEAEVFVGENVPYVISDKFDANNNPVRTYDYRDVGVKLQVVPHINSKENLIRLDIYQEVKTLITVDRETGAPTTRNRYTKTTVQLLDGSTMVISGLIQDDTQRGKRGVPGLGDLPLIGWLFKRESKDFQRATLMVFVSARIIRTMDTAKAITREKQRVLEESGDRARQMYENEFNMFKEYDLEKDLESEEEVK